MLVVATRMRRGQVAAAAPRILVDAVVDDSVEVRNVGDDKPWDSG